MTKSHCNCCRPIAFNRYNAIPASSLVQITSAAHTAGQVYYARRIHSLFPLRLRRGVELGGTRRARQHRASRRHLALNPFCRCRAVTALLLFHDHRNIGVQREAAGMRLQKDRITSRVPLLATRRRIPVVLASVAGCGYFGSHVPALQSLVIRLAAEMLTIFDARAMAIGQNSDRVPLPVRISSVSVPVSSDESIARTISKR